jgi:hypothetical protein
LNITIDSLKAAKDVTSMVKQAVETVIALFKTFGAAPTPAGSGEISSRFTPRKGDFVNTVLLVGMEGTGKTELIRNCFGHANADSTRETEDFAVYTAKHMQNGKNCWVNVADYMGQNVGTLISSFIGVQREQVNPLKYGHIHSLVLMVDLRFPEADRAISAQQAATGDLTRIKANCEQWNEMAVDAIFGLLTDPPLRYVCLFINKYDLISEPKKFSKVRAEKYYANLLQYLDRKVKPIKAGGRIKVDVIVGSAKYGDGHSELIGNLYKYSAPLAR